MFLLRNRFRVSSHGQSTVKVLPRLFSTCNTLENSSSADSSRSLPVIAQKGPYKILLNKGQRYSFCTCGLSEKQPFCDGKHKQIEGFKPHRFIAELSPDQDPSETTVEVYLCGCKHSTHIPFCDSTHEKL